MHPRNLFYFLEDLKGMGNHQQFTNRAQFLEACSLIFLGTWSNFWIGHNWGIGPLHGSLKATAHAPTTTVSMGIFCQMIFLNGLLNLQVLFQNELESRMILIAAMSITMGQQMTHVVGMQTMNHFSTLMILLLYLCQLEAPGGLKLGNECQMGAINF